jgi:hypothetical protein
MNVEAKPADSNDDSSTSAAADAATDDSAWVTVDKVVLESITLKGIEKQMGFEGIPDPATGFYCVRSIVCWTVFTTCVVLIFRYLSFLSLVHRFMDPSCSNYYIPNFSIVRTL